MVVNHVLELQCEVSGIPTPSLTWLKDGRPLPQTDSLRLLRGGEVLRVGSAQVTVIDQILLTHILSSGLICFTRMLHYIVFTVSPECHASVQVEDAGRYSCLANSPAGDDDKEFLVRVHGG